MHKRNREFTPHKNEGVRGQGRLKRPKLRATNRRRCHSRRPRANGLLTRTTSRECPSQSSAQHNHYLPLARPTTRRTCGASTRPHSNWRAQIFPAAPMPRMRARSEASAVIASAKEAGSPAPTIRPDLPSSTVSGQSSGIRSNYWATCRLSLQRNDTLTFLEARHYQYVQGRVDAWKISDRRHIQGTVM